MANNMRTDSDRLFLISVEYYYDVQTEIVNVNDGYEKKKGKKTV